MQKNTVFQAAFYAAIVAFVCLMIMAFGIRTPQPGIHLQPSQPTISTSEFVRTVNEYPNLMLRFFTADSLFVLSYLIVFIGLHAAVVARAPTLAWIGLGAGILAALLDATENAFFITYALLAQSGNLLTDPALPLIYVIANLKWMGAFATLYTFGLVWARDNWSGWILSGLMLFAPLFGIMGIAFPHLEAFRGLIFLLGMPLFAWYFYQRQQTI